MLPKSTLDKLIPLPTEEEELSKIRAELQAENYPVTNLSNGGVFYTLLRIVIRIKLELLNLARTMLSNVYLSAADDIGWLELRAADFGVFRKQAVKAQGALTLSRTAESATATVKIRKGCIFKTEPDFSGEELRFVSLQETAFPAGTVICEVPVEAELAGKAHNVPSGKITRCLLHIESVSGITNIDDWITREGSDIEEIEAFRARVLGVWSRLAANPTRDKYKDVCEAVPGVLYIGINDQHPRGQGTVDIIVTSSTGAASEALLEDVRAAAEKIAGPYDNLLVKSSETIPQDVAVTIVLPAALSDDGVIASATDAIRELFEISRDRQLNELYVSDLIVTVKQEVPTAKSIRVTSPASDLLLGADKVIVLGDVAVTLERT